MPAVDVHELAKSFGDVAALAGTTWSAHAGQITAVLGPNGAGKTTMVECLEGLQRPDSGRAQVLGTTPWNAPAEHRARVGVMLQEGGLPGTVKPVAFLDHLARLYAAPVPVGELVASLGIDAFARTSIRRLSGGQRQRVALAAALVGNPEVVFLDEPTAGLDPHARREVWDLIRATAGRGAAVVVTTHSFEEAERLADRIVIVAAGAVVADDTLPALTTDQPLEDLYFALTDAVR